MNGEPLVSVIIPFFNCKGIVACLESIHRQSYKNYEVIVVNNNSSKGYLRLLDNSQVNILHEPVQSSYTARNRGLKHAQGEYVVFTDADCIAHENWLKELCEAVKANNADMVLGHVQKTFSAKGRNCERVDRDIYHNHQLLFSQGMGTTANLMISKEFLQKIVGFSTEYFSGGDIDFVKNALDKDAKYTYAPAAVVNHQCRRSLLSLMAKGFRTGVADGNRAVLKMNTFRDRLRFLRGKCLILLNPFRDDITNKLQNSSFSYVMCYYFHFAAHGVGRLIGLWSFSRKNFFKRLMRYT